MKNRIHTHLCHICLKEFECSAISHCSIEDRYAVCYSKECIEEFENPIQREERIKMKIKLSDDEHDILKKSLTLNRGDFMKAVVDYI